MGRSSSLTGAKHAITKTLTNSLSAAKKAAAGAAYKALGRKDAKEVPGHKRTGKGSPERSPAVMAAMAAGREEKEQEYDLGAPEAKAHSPPRR